MVAQELVYGRRADETTSAGHENSGAVDLHDGNP
jgi:hypothetical protein